TTAQSSTPRAPRSTSASTKSVPPSGNCCHRPARRWTRSATSWRPAIPTPRVTSCAATSKPCSPSSCAKVWSPSSPLRSRAVSPRPRLRDLLAAQSALLRARRRLKQEPIGNLTERRKRSLGPASGDEGRAEQLARAVQLAARYGLFRPFCLVRAVALEEL